MYTLTIRPAGQRTMERRFKDGSKKNAMRFFFDVSGDPKAIAQYKRDVAAKKHLSGATYDDGKIKFFSWSALITGEEGTLMRSEKGFWFVPTDHIALLNSKIEQIPSLAAPLAEMLWKETFGLTVDSVEKDIPEDEEI